MDSARCQSRARARKTAMEAPFTQLSAQLRPPTYRCLAARPASVEHARSIADLPRLLAPKNQGQALLLVLPGTSEPSGPAQATSCGPDKRSGACADDGASVPAPCGREVVPSARPPRLHWAVQARSQGTIAIRRLADQRVLPNAGAYRLGTIRCFWRWATCWVCDGATPREHGGYRFRACLDSVIAIASGTGFRCARSNRAIESRKWGYARYQLIQRCGRPEPNRREPDSGWISLHRAIRRRGT